MSDKVKEYWDERAARYANTPAATTNDVYLRELEIETLTGTLRRLAVSPGETVLDVGCGNGYSTLQVAGAFPEVHFLGIDYSEKMIEAARKLLGAQPHLGSRVAFQVGDVLDITATCGTVTFAVVMTDRCLINLDSFEKQAQAVAQIAAHTKPGGHYIAIENFLEGQANMDAARRAIGLEGIPIRWHNLYFTEPGFRAIVEPFFDCITFHDFSSSYYLATRVIYSAMCKMRGEEPDYHHEIHRLAVKLPWCGQFSPIRMAVMRRRVA